MHQGEDISYNLIPAIKFDFVQENIFVLRTGHPDIQPDYLRIPGPGQAPADSYQRKSYATVSYPNVLLESGCENRCIRRQAAFYILEDTDPGGVSDK